MKLVFIFVSFLFLTFAQVPNVCYDYTQPQFALDISPYFNNNIFNETLNLCSGEVDWFSIQQNATYAEYNVLAVGIEGELNISVYSIEGNISYPLNTMNLVKVINNNPYPITIYFKLRSFAATNFNYELYIRMQEKLCPFVCEDTRTCAHLPMFCSTFTRVCPIETPHLCADNTCQTSPTLCIPSICGAGSYLCWDGSCKESKSQCPTVSACHVTLPKRCPNGTCVGADQPCLGESTYCPFQYQACPDGSCVPSINYCENYNGCPNTRYQCPDGRCVASYSECYCQGTRKFQCFDDRCVDNVTECMTVPWSKKPLHTTYNLDAAKAHRSIPIWSADFTGVLCTLDIPDIFWEDSIPMKCQQISDRDSRKARNFESKKILSPMLGLSMPDAEKRNFTRPPKAILNCTLDVLTSSEFCLGYLNSMTNRWECLDYPVEIISNTTFQANISSLKQFAFIDRSINDAEIDNTGKNEVLFGDGGPLYIIAVCIAFVAVGIGMVAVYIKKKKERQEELKAMKGKINLPEVRDTRSDTQFSLQVNELK